MLDHIHNQALRLCLGAFRTSTVESLVWVLDIQMVFDNKYMKLFDARLNAISPFGLRTKQFVSASNMDFSCGNAFIFCFTILLYQITKDCTGYDPSENRLYRCINISTTFNGNSR